MKSKPRICVTCGTTYEFCPKCTKDADKPVWMVAFHTEECRKVYNIIAKYNTGDVTKEDAKKNWLMLLLIKQDLLNLFRIK